MGGPGAQIQIRSALSRLQTFAKEGLGHDRVSWPGDVAQGRGWEGEAP